MSKSIRFRAPMTVSIADMERALVEHTKDQPDAATVNESARGAIAEHAATQLNRALALNAFDVLALGWAKVPAVRNAVQLSVLKSGPPGIVRLDAHTITSSSTPVLQVQVAQDALPEVKLALEIVVGVQSATLAARDGRIELIALGRASVIARLKYKNMLLKEHATTVEGALKDPFRRDAPTTNGRAGVDIYL